MDYRGAGVDIDAHAALVARFGGLAAATARAGVIGGLGLFAGAFALGEGPDAPALVASTDSVGTKVLLAAACGRHEVLGRDVVIHCANDVATTGAAPLFFLDYLGVHHLEEAAALAIVGGVAAACREAGCALLGGETAQLPDLYRPAALDVAGTMVGLVERGRLVRPAPAAGDLVLALPSSGLQTNGFSLVRRILEATGTDPAPHADALLAPSALYSGTVARLLRERVSLHGMAHITGGGLAGNLNRVLGDGLDAVLDASAWTPPPVFPWLQALGGVSEAEMRRVFNLGVGFCLVVPASEADAVRRVAPEARTIGTLRPGAGQVRFS